MAIALVVSNVIWSIAYLRISNENRRLSDAIFELLEGRLPCQTSGASADTAEPPISTPSTLVTDLIQRPDAASVTTGSAPSDGTARASHTAPPPILERARKARAELGQARRNADTGFAFMLAPAVDSLLALDVVGEMERLENDRDAFAEMHEIADRFLTLARSERDEAVSILSELADLMDATREHEYEPDAFTTQPARLFLARAKAEQEESCSGSASGSSLGPTPSSSSRASSGPTKAPAATANPTPLAAALSNFAEALHLAEECREPDTPNLDRDMLCNRGKALLAAAQAAEVELREERALVDRYRAAHCGVKPGPTYILCGKCSDVDQRRAAGQGGTA